MKKKEFTWSLKDITLTTYDATLKSVLFDGVCGLFLEGGLLLNGTINAFKPIYDMEVGFAVNLARGFARDISHDATVKNMLGDFSACIPWTIGSIAGGLKSQLYKGEPFIKGAFKIFSYEYMEDLPKDDNAKGNIIKSFGTSLAIEEAGEIIHYLYNSYYDLDYKKLVNFGMTAIGTAAITAIIQTYYIPLKEIDNDIVDYIIGSDINFLGSEYSTEL